VRACALPARLQCLLADGRALCMRPDYASVQAGPLWGGTRRGPSARASTWHSTRPWRDMRVKILCGWRESLETTQRTSLVGTDGTARAASGPRTASQTRPGDSRGGVPCRARCGARLASAARPPCSLRPRMRGKLRLDEHSLGRIPSAGPSAYSTTLALFCPPVRSRLGGGGGGGGAAGRTLEVRAQARGCAHRESPAAVGGARIRGAHMCGGLATSAARALRRASAALGAAGGCNTFVCARAVAARIPGAPVGTAVAPASARPAALLASRTLTPHGPCGARRRISSP
jgi:hypothetical protein